MVNAFVLLKVEPARIVDLAAELADLDGVAEVYSVAGEVDLVAILRVRHHDDLAQVVTGHISTLPGIIETRTMIAFKAYSRHDLDALWNLGSD
ncbi:MAG: Lrp/AsnC ligand binding domain-containing protein [Acidimicrobiales bacterium]|nr:Lrp/AsnC ligand binding domain-containing protein [Acidimicrobiales bacterium]